MRHRAASARERLPVGSWWSWFVVYRSWISACSTKLHKGEHEATVHELAFGEAQAVELQGNTALEAAIGNFQPHDIGVLAAPWEGTAAENGQDPALGLYLYGFRCDTRQGHDDAELPFGLEHVDGRLPARVAGALACRLEEL